MNFKKGLLISLIIHSIIIFLIFFRPSLNCPCQSQPQAGLEGSVNVPIEEVIVEPGTENKKTEEDDQSLDGGYLPKDGRDCGEDDWYGGIGVEHQPDGVVLNVPKSYPAYKSGIRVGDIIKNVDDLRGLVDMEVRVFITREGKDLYIDVTRTKICVKNLNNIQEP